MDITDISATNILKVLSDQLPSEYDVRLVEHEPQVQVIGPFRFPDHFPIPVFVQPTAEEQIMVTDRGNTFAWLSTNAVILPLGWLSRVERIMEACGVSYDERHAAQLQIRCTSITQVTDAVKRLGEALKRITHEVSSC